MSSEPSLEPTLQELLDQTSLKWIFVGGKGGVGKTTCSCSLAIKLSEVRSNVLIISTDPAHNLSDAFRQKFTSSPTLVKGFSNLSAMEVDPSPETGDFASLDESSGSFLSDLTGSIPGIDEAMSFAEVMRQVQTMDYSCIVFDTAPTGHTLRLLQIPSTLQKGLAKLMSLRGLLGGALSQISSMLGGPDENGAGQLLGKLEQLKDVVEEVNTQFKDPELTTFVCVCIPEFLSLYETERLVQELARFDIDTCNIVINNIIFEDAASGSKLLQARVQMQQRYLQQFYDLYEDFHIVQLPLLEEEVRGVDALRSFSANLLTPYVPQSTESDSPQVQQLRQEVADWKAKCEQLERRIAGLSTSQ